MSDVKENPTKSRYELDVNGEIVYATYRKQDGRLYIDYVEAPASLRGTGAAGQLMEGMMQQVRKEDLKVTPICGYAASWLRRHASDYGDMVV